MAQAYDSQSCASQLVCAAGEANSPETTSLRAQRSNPAELGDPLDCFVASLLAMTADGLSSLVAALAAKRRASPLAPLTPRSPSLLLLVGMTASPYR
ncbi:MAG TPA: hypothetical protein VEZ20_08105 [Allosphingosinicella sp.]|jgi:hypothetical protein|nr:hypothetical protein [Allosphingosinicella sp.]